MDITQEKSKSSSQESKSDSETLSKTLDNCELESNTFLDFDNFSKFYEVRMQNKSFKLISNFYNKILLFKKKAFLGSNQRDCFVVDKVAYKTK